MGRPRDGNDRVAWLSERGRYAEALTVADDDYTGALVRGLLVCLPVPRTSRNKSRAVSAWCGTSECPPHPALYSVLLFWFAPAVKPAVKESLGEQFLQALAAEERWAEAAALCPRVLKVSWLRLLGLA